MRKNRSSRRAQLFALAGLALAAGSVIADDSPDGDLDHQTIIRSAAEMPYTVGVPFIDAQGSDKARFGFVFGGGAVEGDGPNGIAYTPDGSSFVIAHRESQNLVIWDAASLTLIGSVDLPGSPVDIAISPDGSTAVVPLVDTGDAAIVDLNTMTVTAVVPIGLTPGAAVIMPAGDLAVVTAAFDSELVVIDLNTNTEVRRISDIGFRVTLSFSTLFLQRLAYSSPVVVDNDRVMNLDRFRPNPQPDEIQFINVRTGAVHRLVPSVSEPHDVDISADGLTAIVVNANMPALTRIDIATETITGTIALPENANFSAQIAVNNDASRAAYTISNNTRTINLTTGVAGPLLGTATLNDLITTPDGNRVAGIGFRGSVIDLNAGTNLGNLNQIVSTDFGAMSPDGSRIVQVASTFGESFVVIEPDATPQLIDTRLTGPDFEGDRMSGVAISSDGSKVVGRNRVSNNAVIMDADSMSVIAQVDAGARPDAIGITPDGSHAVVANGDSFFATVIDLGTNTATNVPMGRRGSQVVFSPDSQFAYIPVVADGDGVTRINLGTLAVDGAKITTGNMGGVGYAFSQASGIAISPDGSTIATAGSFTDDVSFIDATNWVDLGDTFSGDFPTFVAFSPDGTKLVATNSTDDSLSVFDVATRTLIDTIFVGDNPGYPVVTDDNRVFLINFNDDTIGVVDLGTSTMTSVIPFFSNDFASTTLVGLQLDNANDRLYVAYGNASITLGGDVGVAIAEEGFIDVIDTNTLATLETIDIHHGPSDLAASSNFELLATGAPIGDGANLVANSLTCIGDIADDFGTLNGGDGMVSFGDFLALLGLVGPCPGGVPGCMGDFADDFGTLNGGDGMVSFGDFLALLGLVGPCP